MFGRNSIVGQKYFDNAGDKLFVTSIFYTLQGEGPYRGEPAVFLRLAKCNLACSFCDTYFDGGDWLTFDQVHERIQNVMKDYFEGEIPTWGSSKIGLVITGGEPMLQKNLTPFLESCAHKFSFVQIESNGTIVQNIPDYVTLVVSPKCLEKNGQPVKYLQPNPAMIARADCMKFVMNADQDSPYSTIPDWADQARQVFISPMNIYNREPQKSKQIRSTKNDISLEERSAVDEVISFWEEGLLDMKENQKNHEYAARYCARNGYILNLQIHLYASLA